MGQRDGMEEEKMVQRTDQSQEVTRFFAGSTGYWRDLYLVDAPFNSYAYPYHRRQANGLALLKKHMPPPATVLDVGCGAGVQVLNMARLGYTVQGVDLVADMIESARALLANYPELAEQARFDVASIGDLPFADESFAAVVCLGVMEYMDDPATAVAQLARVLKPGGIAIISVPNQASPFRRLGRMATRAFMRLRNWQVLRFIKYRLLLRQQEFADSFEQPGSYRHRAFTAVQFQKLLIDAGLQPVDDVYQVFGTRISDFWLPIPFALVRRMEGLNRWRGSRWLGADYLVAARKAA